MGLGVSRGSGSTMPKTASLYDTIGVAADATQEQIKKAYRRLALRLHPDKNPGDETAQQNFQALQRLYTVLSDPERRRVYDQTGSLDDAEELTSGQFTSLYEYYRSQFKEVTVADVQAFEEDYRGSPGERKDLLELYGRFEGDMSTIMEHHICSEPLRDSHRLRDILRAAIDHGDINELPAFSKWAKKVDKRKRPPAEPKRSNAPTKADVAGTMNALAASIRSRQAASADAMVAALESKYDGKGKGRKATKCKAGGGSDEPSEADFLRAQSRVQKKRQRSAS